MLHRLLHFREIISDVVRAKFFAVEGYHNFFTQCPPPPLADEFQQLQKFTDVHAMVGKKELLAVVLPLLISGSLLAVGNLVFNSIEG